MDIVSDVVAEMQVFLDAEQIEKLKIALIKCLSNYDLQEKVTDLAIPYQEVNNEILKKYFAWKATEGKSNRTLKQYKFIIDRALQQIRKPIPDITEDDLFLYIALSKSNGASSTYLRNIRNNLSSMFNWLYSKQIIQNNPMRGIGPIKVDKTIKNVFSDVDIEKLKSNASCDRDRAIIEILLSTGMRISEMINLNRQDIDFNARMVKVYGKGGKERIVYISNVAIYFLIKYLKNRTDTDPALFIGLRKPYKRLDVSAVQRMLKELGKKVDVENVHPHRFRRTLATNLLQKGMSIEEVSQILGHEKLDTTMIYCNVSQNTVKNDYMRIMCG